ncbi:MAG: hypothetical protein GY906_04775 [bacterium]|nr:hypothetical protein [bacterium]
MMNASDFNLNFQRYVIAETISGVETLSTVYTYATEAAAQGYINTFGGTRDLRIAHLVKVRDNKHGNVPAGTPVLWAIQRKDAVTNEITQHGNLYTAQSSAAFWVGLYNDPQLSVKMLTEYLI